MTPLVSVITPCRNAARWLDEAIRSVRGQDFQAWEMLVVDDRSQDDSARIVAAHSREDPRVQLLQAGEPLGGAGARNYAIARARGRYLAFLDADDWWDSAKLGRQLAFMQQHALAISYTAYEKIDQAGARRQRVFLPPPRIAYADLLRTCAIGCSTVMLDQQLLGRRAFPPLPRSHDYALWLEIMREGHVARGLPEPLTAYREHAGSLSSNKFAKLRAAWQIYRTQESLGRFASGWLLASYIVHGIRKRRI